VFTGSQGAADPLQNSRGIQPETPSLSISLCVSPFPHRVSRQSCHSRISIAAHLEPFRKEGRVEGKRQLFPAWPVGKYPAIFHFRSSASRNSSRNSGDAGSSLFELATSMLAAVSRLCFEFLSRCGLGICSDSRRAEGSANGKYEYEGKSQTGVRCLFVPLRLPITVQVRG